MYKKEYIKSLEVTKNKDKQELIKLEEIEQVKRDLIGECLAHKDLESELINSGQYKNIDDRDSKQNTVDEWIGYNK